MVPFKIVSFAYEFNLKPLSVIWLFGLGSCYININNRFYHWINNISPKNPSNFEQLNARQRSNFQKGLGSVSCARKVIKVARIIVLIKQQTFIIHEIYFYYSSKSSINGTAIHSEISFLIPIWFYIGSSVQFKGGVHIWEYLMVLCVCVLCVCLTRCAFLFSLKIYSCITESTELKCFIGCTAKKWSCGVVCVDVFCVVYLFRMHWTCQLHWR